MHKVIFGWLVPIGFYSAALTLANHYGTIPFWAGIGILVLVIVGHEIDRENS